ncbi:hypothetical protein BDY24DRAFT_419499, partial [Mrakia frigida]|uniref:uncharacterized protein n=1 Tax=Mrakia frigida TaxID=29902 RepID=UPI003FCBFFC9
RADIYLLDDPLCAVDNHVAAHLFAKVLGPNGLLKGKARVLCTNSVAFLSHTDNLLMLRGGEIVEQSTYDKVMETRDSPLFSLINGLGKQTDSSPGTPGDRSDDATTAVEDLTDELDKLGEKTDRSRRSSTSSSRRAVLLSPEQCKAKALKDLRDSARPKETMERGQVKTRVYKEYISAASVWGVALFLFATFAAQGFSIGGNLVLRAWGEHNLEENKTASIGLFLFFYGLTGLSSSLLSMVASLLLWTYMAIRCSRKLHDSSFKALMRSPLSYFESTPQGRILNLFSRDIHVVDEVLIGVFNDVFRCFAVVGGVMVVVGYGAPAVLVGVIPVGLIYQVIMKYYLATSRELKRLDATSRAPIFSWFGETLNGLSVIRAFGQQDRFLTNNEARLDRSNTCYLPGVSVNRWLAVRLEFLGSLLMFSAALASVFALVASRNVDAGLVGLILSYALSVPNTLNWLVRSASEVENNIVSVERLVATRSLTPEAPDQIEETKPSSSWPEEGAIEFRDYSTRYREDLEPCIKGISLKIEPGEKIGVCGRTGAGKSSLTLALFRIIEATGGSIWIDGVDISTIGLHDLRSKISIIPRTSLRTLRLLFEGTLRENVDPIGAYSDVLIWEALEHAHLKPYVEKMEGKLDGAVSEGGQNLSSGQRQLICFARALLRKSRILVLDEATSAIDLETDAAVQEILRGPDFASITTITIAH